MAGSVSLFQPTVIRHNKKTGERVKQKAKVWWMGWRVNGRLHRESTGTPNKKLAKQKAAEMEEKLFRQKQGWFDPAEEFLDKTWTDAVEEFLQHKIARNRPDTVDLYRRCLKSVESLTPVKLVQDISQNLVEDFMTRRLLSGVEPTTVNKELRHLRAFVRWAKKLHYLRVLPEIKELPADVKEPVSVPAGDLRLVLRAIPKAGVNRCSPEWWRLWLQVALFTGARRGELFGLTWQAVNWDTKTVTIYRHSSKGRRDRRYEDAIDLIRVLREWFESQPDSPTADDPVFPWPYASPRQFYFDWAKIIAAAGVDYFKPHNLRSSAVSELGEGEELIAIRDWVGHQSIKTTERFYSNTRNARRKIARKRKVIE